MDSHFIGLGPSPGGTTRRACTRIRYAVLDIDSLRPHERTEPPLVDTTAKAIRADGFLRRPILVESKHHVILDGHHRWEALKVLGCSRIPVYLVEYADDGIGLTTWPGAIVSRVAKDEVVDRGLRGDLFPPKTTRHLVRGALPDVRVSLDDLR